MFASLMKKKERAVAVLLAATLLGSFLTPNRSVFAEEKKTLPYEEYMPSEDELWTAEIIRRGKNEALTFKLEGYDLGTKARFRHFVVTQVRKISAEHRPSVLFDFYVTP